MKSKKVLSMMLILVFFLCGCIISPFGKNQAYAAEIQGSVALNKRLKVDIPGEADYLYPIHITKTGVLTISGDAESRYNGNIRILDNNGNIVASDSNYWSTNNITGKDNLSLVYQCTPGHYYIEINNNNSESIYSVNMYLKYTTVNTLKSNVTLKGELNRNEMRMYKVNLPCTSYLNFKGNFYSPSSLTIYVLDKKGTIIDHDYSNSDWEKDNTTNLYTLDYNSITLKKGTYYIKIDNQMSGSLSYKIKFSVKVPATKIKLNKTKLTLKKGSTFTLKATLYPSKTTDKIKWTSSNKSIATVSSKGVVKAKKKGRVYVTAMTSRGLQKDVLVTVK